MPDVEKLFEKAAKYVQKQKFESALETYQEIFKYEPNDEEVLLNLGDLSQKLNKTSEALRYQGLLADSYIRRNDLSKAVATCRKILKISPQDVGILTKLAALLEKAKKHSDALDTYQEALALHRQAGDKAQAQACLEHIVKLDPNNLQAHVDLGELAAGRQPKVAAPVFLKAAQLARGAGDENRWAELVERAYALDSADPAVEIAQAEVWLGKGQAAQAATLLEPLSEAKPDDLEVTELLCRAYMTVGDYVKAQPLSWKIYQAHPDQFEILRKLAEGLVQSGQADEALAVASQLKAVLYKAGKRNEFLQIVEKIYEADESNLAVLEMLSGLYNEMNREDGLRRSLARLFHLHLAAEQYEKAADTLERIIDVDPYGEGHYDRLVNLEGHIDKLWYQNIGSRLQVPSGRAEAPSASGEGAASTAESLDDLVIEGEMFHQYQLTSKLQTTLEKIQRLFPGTEEENARLRDLYHAAGFHPAPAGATLAPGAHPSSAPAPESARPPASAPTLQSLDELRRISEITGNLYREGTAQGVMQVAVNEIGRALSASRCWGALGTADRPPALWAEYCAPTASASEIGQVVKLYAALMQQAASKPDGWAMEDPRQFSVLVPLMGELKELGIQSVLALPLMDCDQPSGLLLVEQCDGRRAWAPGETILVNTIATQVVIAVNNTKLRRLVRSLAGTDEETGMLPRSSYIDCLLSEAARAKNQSQPLSVCLIEPANAAALVKSLGHPGLQSYLKQVAKSMQSTLRQNDIVIRYNPCSIAVLLADTALPQGGLAVEKLRRAITQIKLDKVPAPAFCAAVCDVHMDDHFDAVDGVTEVINRLESALEQARKDGGKRVFLSKFEP
jgi:diguanylate cyclase (GGDEF)-like protein